MHLLETLTEPKGKGYQEIQQLPPMACKLPKQTHHLGISGHICKESRRSLSADPSHLQLAS